MRSRRSVLLLSGVLSVIVLVALGVICIAPSLAAAPVTDMNQIVGRDWVLTQMDENPAPDEPPVTLTFGIDGNLFGAGGCNQYYGSYKFNSGKITIGSIGATKMMCPPAIMKIEYSFLEALAGTSTLTADNNTLTLCPDGKPSCLVFKAE